MADIHHLKLVDCEEKGNETVAETFANAINRLPSEVVIIGIADGKFFIESSAHESTVNLITVALHKLGEGMARELKV